MIRGWPSARRCGMAKTIVLREVTLAPEPAKVASG